MATQSKIPAGYTFLNVETMITTKGKEIAESLLKQAGNRDPDAFDMYIYNDFYSYGVFDLIDKTLATLHSKTQKKMFDEAWVVLEALATFMEIEGVWTQCDDAERVSLANAAFGAIAVAILRGLKKEGRLTVEALPSLEYCLKNIASLGDMMNEVGVNCSYADVARGIAKRLFENKTQQAKSVEIRYREAWVRSLTDKDLKKAMDQALRDMANNNDRPWFMDGEAANEDTNNREFAITRTWKDYKAYLAGVPRDPMRGPSWDISSWTDNEKAPFLFSEMDD
ncbi:hypothetical protein BKA70DRAFT_1368848 [Coprinopsis sp. MPI-PUGE-AT-0042]|nr:hypothetical protein BKA70DRAFT_1368848 [Coprinopsis sp. MPI-PUGE-AT-0042]